MANSKNHRSPIEFFLALMTLVVWMAIASNLLPNQAHWDQVNGREPQTDTSFLIALGIAGLLLFWVVMAGIRLARNGPALRRRQHHNRKPAKGGLYLSQVRSLDI